MRKYLIANLILIIGCESDELPNKSFQQLMEFNIENHSVTFTDEEFIGNENCSRIFLSASTASKKNDRFRVELDLTTDGHIREIFFVDYDDNNRHYRTSDFISSKSLTIDDFKFSSVDRSLDFTFEGVLYEIGHQQNTKLVNGKVTIQNLTNVTCLQEPSKITAEINQQPFHQVDIVGRSNSSQTEWVSISDDGMKLSVITATELRSMPIGKYTFTKNDLLNRVIIERYIGDQKATPTRLIQPEEWENFEYEGELIIEEQQSVPFPQTTGSFILKAYKNNNVVVEVKKGKFSI